MVFIHRSIKTRIETIQRAYILFLTLLFLYIDPLKQGLKRSGIIGKRVKNFQFLYIDPLKQGLKLHCLSDGAGSRKEFLYIDPLKQGLKQSNNKYNSRYEESFYT